MVADETHRAGRPGFADNAAIVDTSTCHLRAASASRLFFDFYPVFYSWI